MKKVFSVLLTIVMLFSLCGTFFAAEGTGTVIKLQIGNPVMTVNERERSIDENETAPIVKNGESQNLDAGPEISNGRTMLPTRFIAENFGCGVGWAGSNQMVTITGQEPQPQTTNRILIAYFSRAGENYGVGRINKGNTEIVAEMIAEQTGGTLFQIQPVTPYPEGYEDTKVIAIQEKDTNARPAITAEVENMASYDTIFIGYPIWYGTNPMIINTFLESYDLSGKTIIPFCTAAGSGMRASVSGIKKLCPGSTFLEGFSAAGSDAQNTPSSVQSSVTSWLNKIGVAPVEKNNEQQAEPAA